MRRSIKSIIIMINLIGLLISSMCVRIMLSILTFLRKLRDFITFSELHLVVCIYNTSLVLSLFEYVSPVFIGLNQKKS